MVETPVNLTAEQRELMEEFEATFDGEEGAQALAEIQQLLRWREVLLGPHDFLRGLAPPIF